MFLNSFLEAGLAAPSPRSFHQEKSLTLPLCPFTAWIKLILVNDSKCSVFQTQTQT